MASLVAQTVKRLSTMQETRVQSLGQEDPLEKEMATHSSTIAWKIPWTEEPSRLHVVHGVAKSRTRLSNFTSLSETMQETRVGPLGWEDPLEGSMAAHSNILSWRIPWTEEPDGLQSLGSQKSRA